MSDRVRVALLVSAWARANRDGPCWASSEDYVRAGLDRLGVRVSARVCDRLADYMDTAEGGPWEIGRGFCRVLDSAVAS